MDTKPGTLKATAAALLICVLALLKSIWKHLFPVLIAVLLHGCGKLGYETKYSADLSPRPASDKVALAYYDAVNQSVSARRSTARNYAEAALELGKSISAPLAPLEAVAPRADLAVLGDAKKFDIVRSAPPEPLLPLAKERTEQIVSAAYALRRIAEESFLPVAAPAGFVMPPASASPRLDGWDDVRQAAEAAASAIPVDIPAPVP
jgi:FAD/FMN-containing dehydrogenase